MTAALAELAVVYAGPKLPEEADDAPEYKRTRTATPDIDEGATPPADRQPTPTNAGAPADAVSTSTGTEGTDQ